MQVDVRAAAAAGPLARLPADVLTRLADGHTIVRVAAGGVLYRPGESARLHLVALLQELSRNTFWSVRRRMARHLLDPAANARRGEGLLVRASHQELADHIGTVREVVTRTLAKLRADGYLVTEGNVIRLVDPHALTTLR